MQLKKLLIGIIATSMPLLAFANACNNPRFNTQAIIIDKDGYTNVRSQPNAKSAAIEKVFDHDSFFTFNQKGNWWQVCTPSGQIGYMYHNRIRLVGGNQAPAPVRQQAFEEKWKSGWGQGVSESSVENGTGNQIYIACDDGSDIPSTISFKIMGGNAPADSEILLGFDNRKPEFFHLDNSSRIDSNCRACASNFNHILELLKSHSQVYVRFSDGRESTFSLKGSREAIGECRTNF